MRTNTFIKSMLCLFMGLACHVAWAQTYTTTKQTTAPADGYYLIYSESSSGAGWVHYDASLDRKYRVATDVDLSKGVTLEQDQYIWKLVNGESTFTLQCVDNGIYIPADAAMNKNMSATETANLALTAVEGSEGEWYIYQTNYKNGNNQIYIHTNAPGGYPNLSYWENYSADGTSIRAQFYKISIPETNYTLNFLLDGQQISTATLTVIEGEEITASAIEEKVPEGYYVVDYSLTDNTYTVNVKADIRPVAGKYYRISYDFGTDGGIKYLQSTNSTVKGLEMTDDKGENSLFYVEQVDGNLRLKSVSTGKYLKEDSNSRGLHNEGGNVTFTISDGKIKIQAPSYLHAAVSNGNYYVDHCGNDGCATHSFSVEEVQVKTLTVNSPSPAKASITWNGTTKELPATWSVFGGVEISDATLSVTCPGYAFDGFFEGETSLGETLEIKSLTEDRTITVELTPAFFSENYGDRWVRLSNCSDNNYWATVESTTANGNGKTSTLDYADEKQLWCLVGDASSFVLYNKAAGESLALKVTAATYANSSQATLESDTQASWKFIEQDFGYALVPTHNTNDSNLGINMYGGSGGNLQLYTTGSSNKGSYWTVQLADIDNPLTLSVEVDKVWESSPRVAELTLSIDGASSQTRILGDVDAKKMYLPVGATFSLSSMTYRGYTFNGFGGEYTDATLPAGGLEITASYTANEERTLYYSPDAKGKPYRIPAIAAAPNGHIFAIADNRPSGADIGYGEVDIKCRISTDNGVTWGEEFFVANGDGTITTNNMKYGYGDAAVVADCEQNKLLVMMVAGHTVCHNGRWDKSKIGDPDAAAVNRVARVYATYNETTQKWEWTEPEEVTDAIYSIFLDGDTPTVTSMFIGSGKICQSRVVKKGDYYRLYCAIWTRDGGNRVLYSDDFGQTWNVLGTIADRPAPNGDEPKCEELPDGTVVLSSRASGGRFFNLFTFSDATYTTGTWGTAVKSTETYDGSNQGTNGEIYKLKAVRKSDNQVCDVMLQSVPAGPNGRYNVTVYYKEMDYTTPYTPETFATGWAVGKQVSEKYSAYSTMILQANNRIGFYFEEAPNECIIYIPYTLEDLTAGNYSIYIEDEGNGNTPDTGIEMTTDYKQLPTVIYDLQGRRVLNPTKGIYIADGKKMMVK